jgi:hypothetical protein
LSDSWDCEGREVSVCGPKDLIPKSVAHIQASHDPGPRLAGFFETLIDTADTVLRIQSLEIQTPEVQNTAQNMSLFLWHTEDWTVEWPVCPFDNPCVQPAHHILLDEFDLFHWQSELLRIHWLLVSQVNVTLHNVPSA